jgi:hypothetical protein
MKNNRALPFQNMTPAGWQNLALVAVSVFYLLQVGFDLISHNMCGNLAMDYCAYWSAGKITNNSGYADVYDLNLLTQIQKSIHPQGNNLSIPFDVLPIVYLPIFVIPFQVLSLLSLESGFWVWTLLNLIGFIFYLHFFTKEITGKSLSFRLGLMLMLSLPVFLNLLWGQVNIWLGICVGEFMRAILSKKPFRAGLWLGGWWLKPQLLILIVPILLFQRSIKAIAGFAASTAAVLIVSFSLINVNGFLNLLNLIFGFAKGMPSNGPEIMMNWRMLGLHISFFSGPIIGWIVIIIGIILTLYATSIICKKTILTDAAAPQFTVALLGIFAATGAITWHAHLSMSIILIPPMIYLYTQKQFPEKLLLLWVFMPITIMFIVYILAALMQTKILPPSTAELLNLLAGLRGLILNLVFLAWAVMEHTQKTQLQKGQNL